jgi:hypothetical protein
LVAPFGGLTAADFAASPDRQSPSFHRKLHAIAYSGINFS